MIDIGKGSSSRYAMEATYPNATNRQTADEVASILNQAYQSPLYKKDEQFRGEVIYEEIGEYLFREFNLGIIRRYFAEDDPQRLERVRANIDNLVIAEPANILEVAQTESRFSKIYLSNVLGYGDDGSDMQVTQILENIARNLHVDGLIYVTNHDGLCDCTRIISSFYGEYNDKRNNIKDLYSMLDKDKDLRDCSFLHPELEVDRKLTAKVRKYE